MYTPTQRLEPPEDYEFPYEPYKIQAELMKSVYAVLEEKQIGIFESPTGTGKSLTLTCAALRWLQDHQQLVRRELQTKIQTKEQELKQQESENLKASDWINAQYGTIQQRQELNDLRKLNDCIEEYDQELHMIKERQIERKEQIRQQKLKKENVVIKIEMEKESILEQQLKDLKDIFEADLPQDYGDSSNDSKFYRDVQIFYCSRTHSQLAQVVREVKGTAYGKRVRCITLGSRQQLCINPKIKNLSNKTLINERCLELTQKTVKLGKSNVNECPTSNIKKSNCSCPFIAPSAVQQLAETALVDILDIEELALEGNEQKACAYYAARNAAKVAAQIIFLPYQTLLHHRTRKRSDIQLQDAIVIIDEAHNLLDTIAELHSCELTLHHLIQAKYAIQSYRDRYSKRLNSDNLLIINQLLFVIRQLIRILEQKPPINDLKANQTNYVSRILRTYQLTDDGDFFNIDLFKILEFCERTRFVQKLHGFMQTPETSAPMKENSPPNVNENSATVELLKRLQQEETEMNSPKNKKANNDGTPLKDNEIEQMAAAENNETKDTITQTASTVPIYALITFLEALTEDAEDGRVLIKIDGTHTGSLLKYIVLNPSNYFQDIIAQARAIIIAGGTMQPTNELTEQLFRACPERVRLNFYDHVVEKEAVLPFVVQQGPTGKRLCFNYTHRCGPTMLLELSMILQNLCQVVPAGLVCFFPSYDYLDKVYEYMRSNDAINKINTKKRLFRETRAAQNGQSIETLLKEYDATIKQEGGAILFSVVGGKLSEGLNFKDDLCRGVIVVGMPYANSQSLELQERMNYMNLTLEAGSGNQYYENLCMKAVNQCIGRAVRHINDYAAVYLLDERYTNDHIRKKLPKWIERNLQLPQTFGLVQAKTVKYFKQKKEEKIIRKT